MEKILRIDMGAEGGPKAAEAPVGDYAGFGAEHDRLPRFFANEPVPPHNIVFQVKDEQLDGLYNR